MECEQDIILSRIINNKTTKYEDKYPELFSKEFEDYCRAKILTPEIKRKNPYNNVLLCYLLFHLVCVIFCLINPAFFFLYILLYFLQFITSPLFDKFLKKEQNKYKKIIFPILFSFYKNCKYISSSQEEEKQKKYIKNLELFKGRYRIIESKCEDFFKLKYNNFDVDLCEIFIKNSIGKFFIHYGQLALFLSVKTNATFKSKTIILRKDFIDNNILDNEELVNLENPEFNKKFIVKSTNQVDARRFLTPIMIERILNFCKTNWNNEIGLSYENGYINIYYCSRNKYAFEFINNIGKTKIEHLRKVMIDLLEYLSLLDEIDISTFI